MKAAVIGAGEESLHTIEKAQEYGLIVIALDGNPEAAGLKKADVPLAVDISDEEAVVRALAEQSPDFILTAPVGRYLTATGAANDALGLPGISREMAVLCTDKFLFHKKLEAHGLRHARCYDVEDATPVDLAGKRYADCAGAETGLPLRFPAVLKPRYGSGSRGIHVLSGSGELADALRAVSGEPYVLEECVAGEEYGIDGAVIENRFYMVLLRRKENTPFPARQAVAYFSVLPDEEVWERMRAHMEKVIACLGLRECLLHADVIDGQDGPFVIELSARPSGHNLHNLFTPLCTGVDMAEEYIRHRMGLPCDFVSRRKYIMMIHYFDMEGTVKAVPTQEQVYQGTGEDPLIWECHIKEGERLEPVVNGHGLMGRGFFVLGGESRECLRERAARIKALFGTER